MYIYAPWVRGSRSLVNIKSIKFVFSGYGGRPANDTSNPARWLPGLLENGFVTLNVENSRALVRSNFGSSYLSCWQTSHVSSSSLGPETVGSSNSPTQTRWVSQKCLTQLRKVFLQFVSKILCKRILATVPKYDIELFVFHFAQFWGLFTFWSSSSFLLFLCMRGLGGLVERVKDERPQ